MIKGFNMKSKLLSDLVNKITNAMDTLAFPMALGTIFSKLTSPRFPEKI